jgi:hypothetical protein
MILQRFFEAVLSALSWLVDMLFPRVALLTVLLCLGLGALFVMIVWRSRARSAPPPLLAPAVSPSRERDRPQP